jgi:beta-lactamase regulating signal transducer with metallopeptidase domain
MTTIQFLAEWALRSSILILSGALLLRALRVKDTSIRLAAWTVILCGSLAIPALTAALPKLPLIPMRAAARPAEAPVVLHETTPAPAPAASRPDDGVAQRGAGVSRQFDWARAAVTIYVLVVLALLLRLCVGLAMSRRLLRGSRLTDRATEGIEIRESDRVGAPVTLGIVSPAIVLPGDWRQWDGAKLDAVLAHERSHIRRHDPAVQLLSAVHRALLWHSPVSWFLHKRIVLAAEEASDDAAVAVTRDRALYADVLLDFMQRRVQGANWLGASMARYGRPDERIHRILDGTALSRGVTRWSVGAILAMGSPLAYVAAAGSQSAPPAARVLAGAPAFDALPARPTGQNSREVSAALPGGRLMAQSAPKSSPAARPEPAPLAQSEIPVRAIITEDTMNHRTRVVLQNDATVAVTAIALTGEIPTLPAFDSVARFGLHKELEPGRNFRMTLGGDYQAGAMQVAGAILSDGRTFGDAALVEAILARRRATLEAVGIVLEHLPTNPPPGPLLPVFRSYRGVQARATTDNAVHTALANVNFAIEGKMQKMTGEPADAIIMDITTMLRDWQTDLNRSLPSLNAVQ